MRFGEFLVLNNYISQESLDIALQVQNTQRKDGQNNLIGQLCNQLGFIRKKNLEKALEEFFNKK